MKTDFGNSSCNEIPLTYIMTVQSSSRQTRKKTFVMKTSVVDVMAVVKIHQNPPLLKVHFKCYKHSRGLDRKIILNWILEK
jgi:hypothetical protein